LTQLAAAKYRKLDKNVKERIARKLKETAAHPKRFLSRLNSVEAYKLRVREDRVILDVDWDLELITVLTLGHRSTIYRGSPSGVATEN